jgi:anionic cell wall polymer biosynthesis LytR-Cps2A-Psr (LCP) family protein
MIAGVGLIAVRALTARYDRTLDRQQLLDPTARHPRNTASGPLNFLLIGWDPGQSEIAPHAAAVMMLHVSADLDRAHLVAFPGDLILDLPGTADSGRTSGADLLVAAFDAADIPATARLLSAAISRLMGVQFDAAAIVDVASFHGLIDLVGGIQLDATIDRSARADLPRMDGRDAVDYLRQPRDDRHRTHQQVWRATAARVAEIDPLGNPMKLDQVARTVGAALVVDTNGHSLDDLVGALRKLRPEHVVGVHLPVRPLTAGSGSPRVFHEEAEDLCGYLRRDDLARWVDQNPDWVSDL